MTDVSEQFVILRSAASGPSGCQLQSAVTNVVLEGGPVRLALDSQGLPHLLAPVGDAAVVRDAGSKGVVLEETRLVLEGQEVTFADLACRDPRLTLVFEHLAEDALQRLSAESDRAERVLQSTLEQWRQLLQTATTGRLDREIAMGLAAELEVLAVLAPVSPAGVLETWRGPDQEPHDFVHGAKALEVKATAAVDPNFISISNLDQLDASLVGSLHLAVLHFREEPAGKSLDERIRELIDAGVDKQALIRKVSKYGYTYESDIDSARFTLRGMRLWRVGDDFPGLTRDRLPDKALRGVSRVSYRLDLDVATGQFVANDDARADIARWLS